MEMFCPHATEDHRACVVGELNPSRTTGRHQTYALKAKGSPPVSLL